MIELRSARPEDKSAILAISAQIWGGEDYIPNVLDGWLAESGFVVAELDGQVAGFAKMTLLSPGEVWLEGLRVDPAQRGKWRRPSLGTNLRWHTPCGAVAHREVLFGARR